MAAPTQPVLSWSELNTRLQAIAPRIKSTIAAPAALLADMRRWKDDVEAAFGAGGRPPTLGDPSPAERAALARTLVNVGQRLAALDTQLQAAQQQGSGDARQLRPPVLVGGAVIHCCALLSTTCRLSPEDMRRFASCTALVLGSGASALSWAARESMHGWQPQAISMLEMQARALCSMFAAVWDAEQRGDMTAAGAAAAPPQRVLSWLTAAAGLLEALEAQRSSGNYAQALASCAELLRSIAESTALDPLRLALFDHDSTLCGRYAELLLPKLAALAVGLQLPPERRPHDCSWPHVRNAAVAMWLVTSSSAAGERLARSSGSLPRLLQAALQLLDQAPDPVEMLCVQPLVASAARLYSAFQERTLPQQALQLARQLLLALPSFGEVLSIAAEQRQWEAAAPTCTCVVRVAQLCLSLLEGLLEEAAASVEPPNLGRGGVQAWCAGISAAVRLLGDLAPAAQQPDARVAEVAAEAANLVCSLACSTACMLGATAAEITGRQAELEDAMASLWQAHSTICRALHAGVGTFGQLATGASALVTLATTSSSLQAAARLSLRAMSAAHIEMLRAVLAAPGASTAADDLMSSPARVCSNALISLACALEAAGLASIAAHPDVEAVLRRLVERAQQLAEPDALRNAALVALRKAAGSEAVFVPLLLSGAFAVLLGQFAASSRTDIAELKCIINYTMDASDQLLEAGKAACAAADVRGERSVAAALGRAGAALALAWEPPADLMDQGRPPNNIVTARLQSQLAPPACELAAALQQCWRRPEQAAADALELARASAARACAYLRCANLVGEGGPAAGQGVGSSRCSGCRAVWYCNETCSHANWRDHRRVCKILAGERAAAKADAAAAERRGTAGPSGT